MTGVEIHVTGTPPPPDDLPKSRTGRIPRWVVDEAMGRPIEAPAFRAYGAPDPLQEGRGKGRRRLTGWLTTLTVLAVLLGIGFGAQQLGINPLAGPRSRGR